jgi:plastocyanin
MGQELPGRQDPLVGEVRFKVPLPILIPIAAVTAIAIATIGFSRVLLSIPKEAATAIALVTAVNILIACAVVAMRPRLSQAATIELAIIVLYPLLIGIVIAALNIGEAEEAEASGGGGAAAAVSGPNSIVAENNEFNKDELTFKADQETEFQFANQDSVQHNLAIYKTEGDAQDPSSALFTGADVTSSTTTYTIPGLDQGEAYFQCDFHPSMNGTVTVE